jgi:hypothetical protein
LTTINFKYSHNLRQLKTSNWILLNIVLNDINVINVMMTMQNDYASKYLLKLLSFYFSIWTLRVHLRTSKCVHRTL